MIALLSFIRDRWQSVQLFVSLWPGRLACSLIGRPLTVGGAPRTVCGTLVLKAMPEGPSAEKKAVAEEVQTYAMQIVTHVPLGEWFEVRAVRSNIGTMAVPPPIPVFWGMTKK